MTIATTRDGVCGVQWRARYYVITLLAGNGYIPKPGGRSYWEDGYTTDADRYERDCIWEAVGGI